MRIKAKARLLGVLNGRKVYEFPVVVSLNKGFGGRLEDWIDSPQVREDVIAYTAAQAADAVREDYATRAETEITVYGPKGGKAAYRFIGWYSAIGNVMLGGHYDGKGQLRLTLE